MPGVATDPAPDMHRHPAAVGGGQLADAAPQPVGVTSATGHLDVAVDDDRVTADRPHGDVRTAAEADDPGLGRERHERRGQSRIDRVATVLGRSEPGQQGLLPGGGNGHAAALHPPILSHALTGERVGLSAGSVNASD